jgi:homoprotocatechuate degradation regulator HpaR
MLLLRARETSMAYFRPSLQERGLTEQQWRVLRALREHGELSAAGLSHACVILAPSMTRILRRLADEGLVSSKRSRSDGRELAVRLTRAGERLIDEIAPISERQNALIAERLQPEKLEQLYSLLHDFVELDGGNPRAPASGESQ